MSWQWAQAHRSETCRIYGHYPSNTIFNFEVSKYEGLERGVTECGWCKSRFYPWIADPDWLYCLSILIRKEPTP